MNPSVNNKPKKIYSTIGEVAELCELPPHVLRYWEQEFSQLNPCKRRGNRRYYRAKDIDVILKIKKLLYAEGYTIAGARQQLTANQNKMESALSNVITNLEKVVEDLEEKA